MTKRLFAYLGFTMLGVYTVVYYFGFLGFCAAAALVTALILYCVIEKKPFVEKRVIILVAASVVLSSAVFAVYDNTFKSMSEMYNKETASVIAVVRSDGEERYGMYSYELTAERIDDKNVNYKVLLYSNFKLSCEYGDTIRVKARLNACEDNYSRSRRFVYTIESDEYKTNFSVVKEGTKDIFYYPHYIQDKLTDAAKAVVTGYNGELCSAMTFGAREQLPKEINAMFSRTGLSFLIVVSGLHMSIIATFVLWILKPLGKQRRGQIIRCAITVAVIVLYIFVTGMTASVVRAGTAVILTTVGLTFSKRADAYNNLGLSAILIIVTNPYAVGDIGMLLSFSSMLGIIYIYPRFTKRFTSSFNERRKMLYLEIKRTNRVKRQLYFKFQTMLLSITHYLMCAFFVSLSAIISSMPVVVLALGSVNTMSLIISLVLTPLTALIVVFTLFTALIFYIPILNFLSYLFGMGADFVSAVMLCIVKSISAFDNFTLYLDQITVWIWMAVSAVLAGIALLLRSGKRKFVTVIVISIVFLFASYGTKIIIHSNTVTMKTISTGSPNVIITGGGVEAVLYYGEDSDKFSVFIRRLRASCGDVKTLIIPDDKLKTSRRAVNLLEEFDVERVMLYHSKSTPIDLEEEAAKVSDYREFYRSDFCKLNLGQGVTDTIINDGKLTWQRVESGNISVLIVPDKADAQRLDKRFRTADVIVCGSDIKNIDLLDYHNARFITKYDLTEDLNITLK